MKKNKKKSPKPLKETTKLAGNTKKGACTDGTRAFHWFNWVLVGHLPVQSELGLDCN